MKIQLKSKSLFFLGIFVIGFMSIVPYLYSTHLQGSFAFNDLNSYQQQKYWQYMQECQPLLNSKQYVQYRTCALKALQKASATQQLVAAYCTDSDGGIDYLLKGKVTTDIYPNGIEDYTQAFPNGKTYLMEGGCSPDKRYTYYQKNCKELGINYDVVDGACKIAAWGLLDTYPNLQKIKTALEEIKIWDNAAGKYTINGRDLVKDILKNGYNGLSSSDDSDAYFKKQFAPYGIQYLAETNLIREVVQSLWVETNKITPWSIVSYTENQILNLYPDFFVIQAIKGGKVFPLIPIYPTTDWSLISDAGGVTTAFLNDTLTKTFKLSHKLTTGANNQKQAILQITTWMEKNFMHANDQYGWDLYKKDGITEQLGSGGIIFIPKNLSRYFEERVGGCHEPAALMRGMLVSLNIPAVNFNLSGHGVVYLPTLDQYIHGDHISDFSIVPPEKLLMTEAEVLPLLNESNVQYDAIIQKKMPPAGYYFTNTADDRDGNSMYLWTDSVNFTIPVIDWKIMSDQALPEYALSYDQPNHLIKSTLKKIQTLEELSKN